MCVCVLGERACVQVVGKEDKMRERYGIAFEMFIAPLW